MKAKQDKTGQGKTRKRKSSGEQEGSLRQDTKENKEIGMQGVVTEDVTLETPRPVL